MPKTTIGITGLHEISGRDYGIEEPHSRPSVKVNGIFIFVNRLSLVVLSV